jgi:hypothetical protein
MVYPNPILSKKCISTQNLASEGSKSEYILFQKRYDWRGKKSSLLSPCSSPSDFMMKTQLFGRSWCTSATHSGTFNTPCKPALRETLENVSKINKII